MVTFVIVIVIYFIYRFQIDLILILVFDFFWEKCFHFYTFRSKSVELLNSNPESSEG